MKSIFHANMIAVFLLLLPFSAMSGELVPTHPNASLHRDLDTATDITSSAVATARPVIVFLGDSLTAGFGLRPEAALPQQVNARLGEAGIEAVVINAGVSGDTTANGLARYGWSVSGANADLLVIALGANDYLMGISPDVARSNLAAILDRAKAEGVTAVLVGIKLRSVAQPRSRDEDFSAVFQELAASYNVPLYPALLEGVRDNPELLQPDGLHPTDVGVGIIADGVADFLMPTIQELKR